MKVLNWTKIPNAKLENTVWQNLALTQVGSMPVDFELLEASFRSASSSTSSSEHKKGPKHVSVLAPKRSQAINIFLKSSRMSTNDIGRLILVLDERFTAEFAELLLASLPLEGELEAVQVSFASFHAFLFSQLKKKGFPAHSSNVLFGWPRKIFLVDSSNSDASLERRKKKKLWNVF
jgi:hypothetical protein